MSIFKKKIPVVYTFLVAAALSGATFWLSRQYSTPAANANEIKPNSNATSDCSNYNVSRLKGYQFIKPLVNEEAECESARMATLKQDITSLIETEKQGGVILNTSVFIKELSSGDWTSINPAETFLPGSLFKLPVMITILRMAEADPSLLNKKIFFDPRRVINVPQTFNSKAIVPGQSYTVKELLSYMIEHSDNHATQLLNQVMSPEVLVKVFTDLGLAAPKPDPSSYLGYQIHTHEYSIFMEALYNGSYLTINQSEYATSLLANCNFGEGLVKGLPAGTRIAHKFGEAGSAQIHELHETGIVYLNNNAYLITVMTRGNDIKKLPPTIAEISAKVYAFMKQHA